MIDERLWEYFRRHLNCEGYIDVKTLPDNKQEMFSPYYKRGRGKIAGKRVVAEKCRDLDDLTVRLLCPELYNKAGVPAVECLPFKNGPHIGVLHEDVGNYMKGGYARSLSKYIGSRRVNILDLYKGIIAMAQGEASDSYKRKAIAALIRMAYMDHAVNNTDRDLDSLFGYLRHGKVAKVVSADSSSVSHNLRCSGDAREELRFMLGACDTNRGVNPESYDDFITELLCVDDWNGFDTPLDIIEDIDRLQVIGSCQRFQDENSFRLSHSAVAGLDMRIHEFVDDVADIEMLK